MADNSYTERIYRDQVHPDDLVPFRVIVQETDLWIAARRDLAKEAAASIRANRAFIEGYIAEHPDFASTLKTWDEPMPEKNIISEMVNAGNAIGIGPMAAVAGSIAEAVARDLEQFSDRVLVENGGDLYVIGGNECSVGLWAGPSPLSGRLAIWLDPSDGIAVCTSSGTVGPSLSMGQADAATVIAPGGALADAAATELGNRVKSPSDVEGSLDWALSVPGVTGAVVIMGETIGAKGNVELVPINGE